MNVQTPTSRSYPNTPGVKRMLEHTDTDDDWPAASHSNESQIGGGSMPNLLHMQEGSLSRSSRTYTSLLDHEIRPCRGTASPTTQRSTSPRSSDRPSRISRQRLQNLPGMSVVVLQACRRMYEDSADHDELAIQAYARTVSNALAKQRYDFISFLVASREALTALVSEDIMSLPLLATVLERIANLCRLAPLRQGIDGIPSDEMAALMVDRWLRRTSEVSLDGTIEVATTIMANKACRSVTRNVMQKSNLRGHSSRQRRAKNAVAKEGLPITARVHYSDKVEQWNFVPVDGDAVMENEAPTPARFTHFGKCPGSLSSSPKSLSACSTPTSIFEQELQEVRQGNVGPVVIFPAAQAA